MIKDLEFLFSSLKFLKNVGEKSLKTYKRLLTHKRVLDQDKELKVIDLIYHKPDRIAKRIKEPNLLTANDGDLIIVNLFVDKYEKPTRKNQPHKIRCSNNTGFINIVYFKIFPEFISKNFKEGNKVTISGKVEKFNNELQITHPDYVNCNNIPNFETIYPLTAGLSNRILRQTIQNALNKIPDLPEWLKKDFLFEHQWKSWKESLICLHNAKKEEDLLSDSPYVERLAFDEILANQIALGLMRERIKINTSKNELKNKNNTFKDYFLNKISFNLTNDQKKVISEIEENIYSNKRMLRLLQGDVGSGKTVVGFFSMLPFLQNTKQVALMVPTSILATQHYEWIGKICENFEILFENNNKNDLFHAEKRKLKVGLLTGKIKGKKREKILKDLKEGNLDILVGTHAIFQENVEFKELGYAIIDEQHRFGVSQRLKLIEKGDNIDILIMTATPIPRTLALTLYGDMEVSTIKEKPKNRKEIITSSLQKERFNDLINRIKERIKNKEKIFWICPLIDDSENLQATPLFKRYEEFKAFFDEKEIGFIHGKINEDEKDKIMEDFAKEDGDVKILIATTVIEVGIDVPDATVIVIENPERFGLAQIHQIRGRVGRGDKQSYCVLFYEKLTANSRKRMEILKNTSDGFIIAEEDLKLRGSGEVLGVRQSGYQEYLIANLSEHYTLLLEASKMARYVVENKNILNSYEIKILLEMFGYSDCLNEAVLN